MTKSKALCRVVVENLKGISDFKELEIAPTLEEFALIDGRKQTPQQLLPVLTNPRVLRVCAGFGSNRKNHEFSRLRDKYRKGDFNVCEPFEYE